MGYKEAAAIFHNLVPDGERLSANDKTVLIALAFLSFTVGSTNAGLDTISRQTGLNERTVRRGMERLKQAGLLVEKRRPNSTSIRRVVLPPEWFKSEGAKARPSGPCVRTGPDTESEPTTENSGHESVGPDTESARTGHDARSDRTQSPHGPDTVSTYGVLVGNEDEELGGAREAREEPHPENESSGEVREGQRAPERAPDWCDLPTWRLACELSTDIETAPHLAGDVEVVGRGGVERAVAFARLLQDAGKHVAIDAYQIRRTIKALGGSWRGVSGEVAEELMSIRNALRRYPDAYPSATNRTAAGGRGASRVEHACRLLCIKPATHTGAGERRNLHTMAPATVGIR